MLAGFGHRQNKSSTTFRQKVVLDKNRCLPALPTGRHASRQGQLLIESMVAISILTLGLLGVFSLLSQSLSFYRVAYEEHVGANLAAEGIEIVKNIIDSNIVNKNVPWNQGLASDGDFGIQYDSSSLDQALANKKLMYDSVNGVYNYASGSATNFIRTITIKNISPNEIQVNSKVAWKSRGGTNSNINLEDHFYNWR